MTTRRRERIVRVGSWLVLALAMLPVLTYMGHWPLSGGHVHAEAQTASSIEDHESHCHVGVSHCAGGEAMVGSFWVGEQSDILSLDSPDLKVETHELLAPVEGERVVLLQPPQAV